MPPNAPPIPNCWKSKDMCSSRSVFLIQVPDLPRNNNVVSYNAHSRPDNALMVSNPSPEQRFGSSQCSAGVGLHTETILSVLWVHILKPLALCCGFIYWDRWLCAMGSYTETIGSVLWVHIPRPLGLCYSFIYWDHWLCAIGSYTETIGSML